LLDQIEGNGVRTVIVEDACRLARDLVAQELGIIALIRRGVRVLTANGDDLTDSSDPFGKMRRPRTWRLPRRGRRTTLKSRHARPTCYPAITSKHAGRRGINPGAIRFMTHGTMRMSVQL
jgi:hypothetical protein